MKRILINNLFQFNLDTKEISLINKEKTNFIQNYFSYNQIPKLYIKSREQNSNINNNEEKKISQKKILMKIF